MKRLQVSFYIQTSLRGCPVRRSSTSHLGGVETTDYTYNVRSWPTRIAGKRFTERLCYNGPVEGLDTTRPHQYRWNGTVAAYAWKAAGETRQRGYSLIYDGLDRLTAAHYGEGSGLDVFYSIYDERAAYDGMGNPVWIYRKGPVSVSASAKPSSPSDRLRLEYDGNQLVHVTDTVTSGHNYEGAFHFNDGADQSVEYEYDANGNMTKDLNRNISSIQYNLLNLPSMIQFGDNSYIYNTYSAAGEKLTTQYAIQALPVLSPISGNGGTMETHPAAGTEDVTGGLRSGSATPIDTDHRYYCGNVVYDRGVTRLLTDEGYVTFAADGTPQYHFYLRDHLGNIRVVMGQTGAVEQVNHYYAFGGQMRESTNPGLQPYKYGGKEIDRFSGLDAYDFGARSYFADRMQWSTMDPLCEKYYDVSPYVYCFNNPVMYIDPDGRKVRYKRNTTNDFKQKFANAIKILNEHGVGYIFSRLERLKTTIYIAQMPTEELLKGTAPYFDPKSNTIYWDTNMAVKTNNGTILSPYTILNHEGDHALDSVINPKRHKKDKKTEDKDYGNKMEKKTIEGTEQKTAKALGEIKEGEVTRTDHKGEVLYGDFEEKEYNMHK